MKWSEDRGADRFTSRKVEASQGGSEQQPAAAGCCQMPSRASCVQKRAFPVLIPGVSWGSCKHGSLKKDFWSTFKSPNEAATQGGYNYYNTDKCNNVHGEI